MVLKVYGTPKAGVAAVLWLLEELAVPAELVWTDPDRGDHHQPDYWRLNPFGKVPSISLGDFALAEAPAICSWLADQHADRDFIPKAGSKARGTHDQWLFFAVAELQAPLEMVHLNQAQLPEAERIAAVIPQALDSFRRASRILSAHLQGRSYMLGDKLQVIDLYLSTLLEWAEGFDTMLLDKNLRQYHLRLETREAYQSFLAKYRKS